MGSRAEAIADLLEIRTGAAIRDGERFITSSGRIWGKHNKSLYPISGKDIVNVSSLEYNLLRTSQKFGYDKAIIELEYKINSGVINSYQAVRVRNLLEMFKGMKNGRT